MNQDGEEVTAGFGPKRVGGRKHRVQNRVPSWHKTGGNGGGVLCGSSLVYREELRCKTALSQEREHVAQRPGEKSLPGGKKPRKRPPQRKDETPGFKGERGGRRGWSETTSVLAQEASY